MAHWCTLCSTGLLAALAVRSASRSGSRSERWFVGLATAVLLTALASLALARLGLFSVGAVAAAQLAAAAVLVWQRGRARAERGPSEAPAERPLDRWDLALVATLLSLLALYESFPTYYLLGGRDPGPYLLFAHRIADSGGLGLDQPLLNDFVPLLSHVIKPSFPAIYSAQTDGLSERASDLIPQFMHLYPALAANGAAAFGLEGIVRVNAVVMVLALWGLYAAAARLMGRGPATAVTLLVGLNPAIIWSARITMTEPLSLLLLLLAWVLFMRAERARSPWPWAIAGLVLGAAVLNRIDGLMNVALLVGLGATTLVGPKVARSRLRFAIGAYGLATSAGLLDGWLHTRPYLTDLWELGLLDKLIALSYGGALLALLLTLTPARTLAAVGAERLIVGTGLVAVTALGCWLGYAMTLRPTISDTFAARAAGELAWYVTPIAYGCALVGAIALLRSRRRLQWLPLLALVVPACFIFTLRPAISPDHIWASRRWVTIVIPGLLLLSVGGVVEIVRRVRPRWRGWLVAVAAAMGAQYAVAAIGLARPFLFTSMLEGIAADHAELARVLRRSHATPAVLTDSSDIASVLTYLHGIPTYRLRQQPSQWSLQTEEALAGFGLVTQRPVVRFGSPELSIELGGRFLERKRAVPPSRLVDRTQRLHVTKVPRERGAAKEPMVFSAPSLPSLVGSRDGVRETLNTTGTAGALQYGPYVPLPAGRYSVQWIGTIQVAGHGHVDIVSGRGKRRHGKASFELWPSPSARTIASLAFSLDEPANDVEMRLFVDEGTVMSLKRLEVVPARPLP